MLWHTRTKHVTTSRPLRGGCLETWAAQVSRPLLAQGVEIAACSLRSQGRSTQAALREQAFALWPSMRMESEPLGKKALMSAMARHVPGARMATLIIAARLCHCRSPGDREACRCCFWRLLAESVRRSRANECHHYDMICDGIEISPQWGSNPRPCAYEAHALPSEL